MCVCEKRVCVCWYYGGETTRKRDTHINSLSLSLSHTHIHTHTHTHTQHTHTHTHTQAEIKSVLDLGVSPDRIIYANPCKQASHIKYACKKGVATMTFDNEVELHKVEYFWVYIHSTVCVACVPYLLYVVEPPHIKIFHLSKKI